MIIDAHQHFWRIARGDYGWLDTQDATIRRDFLPPDLAPLAAAGGATGTIAVQAAPTLDETRFLLELAAALSQRFLVSGWLCMKHRRRR
ncbi:hypothetical protein [Roseinatronobacter alkalisoli]|uniref:Amidohydrolase n=1 Tax=Roseinatronobacter alkalisoli TaxID=3028235 RepID=A0ABT5TF77_9RHOB|nr:hypothetical protein [Roseinatronobacter sp. HJB301]MDD7973780.1 hypothetical protein [Roseinatronobacter sp. HJB301]